MWDGEDHAAPQLCVSDAGVFMSWDAMIFNGRNVPKSMDQVPKDWRPEPIGSEDKARLMINEVLNRIVWDTSGYGRLEHPDFSIEFHITKEPQIDSIGVRVVGGGDPIPIIIELCRANGWVVFDNQKGDFIDMGSDPSDTWRKFVEWRDRVIDESNEKNH